MKLGRGGRPLRIGYGRIFHEACAYSPLLTTKENFLSMHHLSGAELASACTLRGSELEGYLPHAELTGFVSAARAAGGVETIPLVSSLAVSGGPLSADTFEWLLEGMLHAIDEAGDLDGIYLALHGSMQVEGMSEAPESVILRRVRARLKSGAKIAVSYDLHANLSAGLIEPVDVLVAYRTNPHWDLAPTGFRAGNRLIRTLRGQCAPVHAWRKLPIVLGGGTTIDFLSPMRAVFRFMRGLERDPRVLSASLFMVHPYTDADDLGWAVHVCTDADEALANELAEQLADRAWAVREAPFPPMLEIDEALDRAAASPWRKLGPVTLVDVDDIVGAGAPGGSTRIVQALMKNDRGLRAYVPVHDPKLVEELWSAPIGTHVACVLRGTPGYHQPEVPLEDTIGAKTTGDCGRTLRLDIGKVHLAITERSPLPLHPKFWRAIDLSPRRADLIVQKNFFHYRIFFAAISFEHLPVVSDGATSLSRVRERAYRVPTYPNAKPSSWRAYDPALRAPGGARAQAATISGQ